MGGDDDKIIRIPGETLTIKVSPEEEAYRKKYLPDAKKLTDEKLVCTVCSVSLAQNIHKGKDIYIHRALQVLVCEACYNFYGDGSFSVDEDGDDKYCRWCGQGGTLFLCSACNCAFCQKCTKQNLKASVLAELENDDWKCYICNPRPLFGCRTICWGAQQLNTIGKEKEQERLKKIKERLEKLEAKKKEESEKRKSRKYSSSEDETSTKKRRRSSDGDDSSPEVMPKRKKRESRVKSASKNLNGSIGRRRKDSSSDAESEEYKKTIRRSRSTKEKSVQSSSDDESDSKSKKDKLKKKKKKKDDSDDSSDSGKKKSKRRLTKKKDSSDEDSSEEEKSRKKKKHPVKKRADSSDDSSDEKKKKKPKKKKNYSSSEESPSETKKKNKNSSKKKAESSDKSSEEDDSAKSPKKSKKKLDKEETSKKQDNLESDNEPKKVKKAATDLEDVNTNSAEDVIVKKRIKLAILWLTTIVKDISELGTLISVRATNFSKKKINTENLKSYEDVINCVGKIKQLIIGVHSNYDHIEKTLESHLKPWKILTGLEDGENEKTGGGESTMAVDGDVSKADNTSTVQAQSQEINGTLEKGKASEKSEENLNNWSDDSDDQNETRAQISKINESLDKSQIEDQQSETGKESAEEKSSEKSFEVVSEEESKPKDNVKKSKESSKSTKKDSEKPDGSDSKPQKPKKTVSKNNTDAVSDSENGERSPRTRSPERNNSNDEKSKAEADAAEEMESEGENHPLLSDREATDHREDSGEEDSQLESFASKLRDKWQTTDEMNLKQPLDLDSSNQSDAGDANVAEDKVLGKNNEKERIPALVLEKLNVKEIEEKNNSKTNNSSNIKSDKSLKNVNSRTKREDKNKKIDKAEGLSSGNEEEEDKKIGAKKNVNKSVNNKQHNNSNCLTSSDEEGETQTNKTKKQLSSKTKNTKEAGERQSKRSINVKKVEDNNLTEGSSNEEERKSKSESEDKSSSRNKSKKNLKEGEESDEEKNISKSHKNKDSKKNFDEKNAEDNLTVGSSNKEDRKTKNKEDKDSLRKKSKEDVKKVEESDEEKNKSKSHKNKDLKRSVDKTKTEEDDMPKGRSNEEDRNSKNKEDKDSLRKKSKEDVKKVEESDEEKNKSKSLKNKELKRSVDKTKTEDDDMPKSRSNEKDRNSKNKDHKSKNKDSSRKQSKKNIKEVEESDEEKNISKSHKNKDSKKNFDEKNTEDNLTVGSSNKELSKNKEDKDSLRKKSKEDVKKVEGSVEEKNKSKSHKNKDLKRSVDKTKTEEDDMPKSRSNEEDRNSKNKDHKSKNKDSSRKQSKKDIKEDEESDEERNDKSKSHKNKESKTSRKSKSKENNSDEECTKNKKKKLAKSKENDESTRSESDHNEEEDIIKRNKKSSEGFDPTDKDKHDSAVVENGAESNDETSTSNREKNMEASSAEVQEDVKNDLNCEKHSMDFKLELQGSSTENTIDIEMTLLKEEKPESEENENSQKDGKDSIMEDEEKPKAEKTKFIGLDSSSEEEIKVKKITPPKKRPSRNQKTTRNVLVLSSDDEEVGEQEKPTLVESSDEEGGEKGEKDDDFAVVVDSADSSDSEILPKNKRKKKGSSDSDDASISEDETKKKKKRRRIKLADSSDESGESGDEKKDKSNKGDGESPAKGGRKNIKKIKKKGDLEQTTIEAAEEEKERRRRIEERQKLFNQVFEIKESAKLEKLVLDFDPETKKELISVDKDLVAKMKPHQAKGVKFMWDSCFESVKQIKKTKGSGCILAHCMGLGKTFQVISLVHTLLTHEELTKVRTVMVVCPLSTVLNWVNEFGKWLEDIKGGDDIEVFHLTKYNKNPDRARELRRWQHNGGVLVMGYEMFRNLTNETTKKFKAKMKKDFLETLIDPGADLIVCDEGHMLKNEATALSKAMTRVKTLRRIVLTGTPMQNNLKEYHCMVQFVKPNLLGTSKEFLNRFVNPINNGQFVDSTDHDVKLMKRRAHVLHKMLEGLVQRFDYNVLTPFLPPKQEYVISVCLSELQEKLYSYYLENESQKSEGMKGGTRLFMDWQTLGRVWTHPRVLKLSTDKANWLKEKKAMEASDSEGSLRDFIDDDSDKSTTPEETSDESSDDDERGKKKPVHRSKSTRATRQRSNVALLESSDEEKGGNEEEEALEDSGNKGEWWSSFIEPHHFEDMRQSGKLMLLFAILKECEMIEDKVLVFSQSLFSLDLIEYFLDKIDAATQEDVLDENLDNHQGTWSKGLDYFRLDGSTSSENRNIWCKAFNREDNPRARLFLISTRAGGLGINLTAANRVIIFDASWNPSHDIQSIFRIYRFGQKKPCYVYRFVAFGTMEEKVYERQVAKQSISNRVVDEQQVHRHFSMNDLTELYSFTPASKLDERPTFQLPRDPMMAEILSKMKQWIEKYHEHDSLLENVVEEELNEEERKAAWEDYENDKKRGFMPPAGPGPAMNPNAAWNQQIELMRQQLKLRYANKSDDEINSILVYQVSLLMRQQQQQQQQHQQMMAQMQAANNMGNMGYRPQMYGNNMTGAFGQARPQMQTTAYLRNIAPKPSAAAAGAQQAYSADQVYRMQQQANLARLQIQQQMAAQQQTAKTQQQQQQQQGKLQSLLAGAGGAGGYPTANMGAAVNARAAAELQRMKQNYQATRQTKPGVVITEITDDKPSGSSES